MISFVLQSTLRAGPKPEMHLFDILVAQALLLHRIIIAHKTLMQQSEQHLSLTFYTIPDHALVGSVIATYQVPDEFACCHMCVQDTRCLSFNYGITTNPNLSICEISSSEQALDRQKLLRKVNCEYHGIDVSILKFRYYLERIYRKERQTLGLPPSPHLPLPL